VRFPRAAGTGATIITSQEYIVAFLDLEQNPHNALATSEALTKQLHAQHKTKSSQTSWAKMVE
jgi:hypothetical protein